MNLIICATQVPFVRGGAEVHVEGLRDALIAAGHRVDIVALPFKWYPKAEILKAALAWRLLDLTEANGVPVDAVICTKFPTWAVRHPRKIAWVIHQHRQAYDWFGTPLSDFTNSAEDVALRRRIAEIDRRGLGECVARFANSANVARRLKHSVGLDAEPLHVPVSLDGLEPVAYGDYILSVSRLDRAKRVHLLLEAMAGAGGTFRAVVAGDGPEAASLRTLARELGIAHRVCFTGRVSDQEVVRLYNGARAVFYAPVDEDYGLVTVEALTAGKPVLTAADAGGVLEFIEDGITGLVAATADARALAPALARLMEDEALARRLGAAGRERVARLRWDRVVERLLANV
ncbi:MAG: glycosyltransferase family 4 protein [Dactylosporangium sp.]|nr:glycosyltransferase family 4 protein [Dactylosporangium sp.]